MDQQPSSVESQIQRIADSLARIEECYIRQAVTYDEEKKQRDEDAKKRNEDAKKWKIWDSQRLTNALANLFVLVLALAALLIALAK
jgi:predicted O-linked N-acetylglucosamine transferase (SPINDLY family)